MVIEKLELPAEVKGLLFADFTSSFRFGFSAVLTALKHEARRKLSDSSFWRQAASAVSEVFGPISYTSQSGEYESVDFEELTLPIPYSNETTVKYESIQSYGDPKPLSDRWWTEYEEALERIGVSLSLVVTERPVGFKVETNHSDEPRITVRTIIGWNKKVNGYVVFVELNGLNLDQFTPLLVKAKKLLTQFASQLPK